MIKPTRRLSTTSLAATARRIVFQQQQPRLTVEQGTRFLALASQGTGPRLSATLFADASHDYDVRRQVLFAAVALEVEIKTLLQEQASPEQEQLVKVLLTNPRDFSAVAAELFHLTCKAVTGRSLQAEDSKLFEDVKKLFKNRNYIAHRALEGVAPTPELQRLIVRAGRALAWCETIRTDAAGRQPGP